MAAWMVSELFAEGGGDVAIALTPGEGGVLQVFADGDKILDKKAEGNTYPDLPRIKQLRAAVRDRLAAGVAAAG